MNIYILRHGDAESFASSDELRKLTPSGRSNTTLAANYLEQCSVNFDACIASPFLRAQETAAIVCEQLGIQSLQTNALLVPEAKPEHTLEMIIKVNLDDAQNLLLISHQPLVSLLIGLLVTGIVGTYETGAPPMYTSSLACLEVDPEVGIAPGCLTLKWIRSHNELSA